MNTTPLGTPAVIAASGTKCTYCHVAIAVGSQAALCPVCDSPHHDDCWMANSGCGQIGCSAGPAHALAPRPAAPAPEVHVALRPTAVPVGAAPQRGSRAKTQTIAVVIACSVLLLAAIGALVFALASMGNGSKDSSAAVLPPITSPPATSTASSSAPVAESSDDRAGDPATASRAEQKRALKTLLVRVHDAEAAQDWEKTFALLSKRKQRDKIAQGNASGISGADAYANALGDDATGLDTSRLDLVSFTVRGRTATLQIAIPYTDGGCYKGRTWAVFEPRRGWRFDPGSDNRPERRGISDLARRPEAC